MSFFITKEALKILAMNNASCKVFGEKKVKNLKYLTACAREEKDFDYDELVANLPEVGVMYVSIRSFARYLKKESIDQETILKFLGGQWHIQYVDDQTDMVNMQKRFGELFVDRFIFSHILIVAEITKVEENITARYSNGDVSVEIMNLVKHPFVVSELVVGQKVLLHQALILEIDPTQAIEDELHSEQAASEKFMATARRIKVIDYAEFWDMKLWTESIIEEL